jgi:ankyrin repeat protein
VAKILSALRALLYRDSDCVGVTLLHELVYLADPSDYSTQKNKLILAKQLIADGAKLNAVASQEGATPLHVACAWFNVTNLDFVELLLEYGADPNAQDHLGKTPLMWTLQLAPGAAKFLLR